MARKNVAFRRFEKSLDTEAFMEALYYADDPKAQELLSLMLGPNKRNTTFAVLCAKAKLSLNDVRDIFRRHAMDTGLQKMYKHVPQVLEDTAIDAQSQKKSCWKCDGTGKLDGDRECPECKGSGELRVPGDKDSRNLIFESVGLTGKSGPVVAQQFNFGEGAETMEDIVKQASRLVGSAKP